MDFTVKLQLSYSSALRIFHAWDLHWNSLAREEVESPGGFQEACRWDTERHHLVDMVGMV